MMKFDFTEIMEVAEKAAMDVNKTPTIEKKVLYIEESDDFSILKNLIISKLNDKHVLQSEFYDYFKTIDGMTNYNSYSMLGNLRHKSKLFDTTFTQLAEYLNLNIILKDQEMPTIEIPDPEDGTILNKSKKIIYIEPHIDDSRIKKLLIEKINSKKKTYGELYDYFRYLGMYDSTVNSDPVTQGYNAINGLKKRRKMHDTTLNTLCDFVGCVVVLEEKDGED